MLRYKCLALDHDDTVVQSEATINYPCFQRYLEVYRPGVAYSLEEYVRDCSQMTFVDMCRIRFSMSEEELHQEYLFWQEYMKTHIPEIFPGLKQVLEEYRNQGGIICVVSMSSRYNILRDYQTHFGFEPDMIFSCELPEELRKPNTYPLEQIQKEYHLAPEDILVVDDMKFAVPMARSAGCPIAFAGWSRKEFPEIGKEMENVCDFRFDTPEDMRNFLIMEAHDEN